MPQRITLSRRDFVQAGRLGLAAALLPALPRSTRGETAPPSAVDREWPQQKGNAGHTGVSADDSVRPPLKLLWSYRLDGDASGDAASGVTVGGGLVFVNVANTRSVVALDADTGRFRWEYAESYVNSMTFPSYNAGRLFFWERQPKSARVLVLDATTGKPLWAHPLTVDHIALRQKAGLPVANGKVFCSEGGDEPAVTALDEQTGQVVWRTGLGKEDGTCVVCPTVAGGTVFVGTGSTYDRGQATQGSVVALEASSGKILWRRRNVYPQVPMASDGRVLVCAMSAKEERKYCLLDAQTGELLWAMPGASHNYTATLTADQVLFKPWGNRLEALDRRTGSKLWQFNSGSQSGCSTPAVAGHFAFLGNGTVVGDMEALWAFRNEALREQGVCGTLHAVDLRTGESVWRFATGNTVCGDPALAYGRIYFTSRDGKVYCFAPAKAGEGTMPEAVDQSPPAPAEKVQALLAPELAKQPPAGQAWPMAGGTPQRAGLPGPALRLPLELAWHFDTGGRIVAGAALRDSRVFAASEAGKVVAIAAADGKPAWEFTTGAAVRCSPAVVDGLVYCGSDSGKFHALAIDTGKEEWGFAAGGPIQASPAVVGGVVIFGANDHHVYALDRRTGRKLWSFRMNDYCTHAPPAVAGEQVFVGQWTDWVWALDLKTGQPRWRSYVPVAVEAVAYHRDKLYVRSPYYIIELDPQTGKRLRISDASYGYGGLGFWKNLVFQSGIQGQYGRNGATVTDLDDTGKELVRSRTRDDAGNEVVRKYQTLEDVLQLNAKSLTVSRERARESGSMVTPLALDAQVCWAARDGQLRMTDHQGQQLWKHQLGGACHAAPIAADGLLVVGCDDGHLYAFRGR